MCGNIFVFPSGCVYSQVMGIHHVHMSFLLMCRDCYFMPLNIHLKNQIQRLHRTGSWHVYFTNLWFFKQFELFASICHCTKNPQWRLTGLGLHTHTDPLVVVTHVLQYFFELLPLFISNPVPSSWRCRPVSSRYALCHGPLGSVTSCGSLLPACVLKASEPCPPSEWLLSLTRGLFSSVPEQTLAILCLDHAFPSERYQTSEPASNDRNQNTQITSQQGRICVSLSWEFKAFHFK